MGNNDSVQRRTWIMDDGSLWFCDFHTLWFCEDLIFWLLGTKPSNKGQISEDVSSHSKSALCWMIIFNEDQGFNILHLFSL